MLMFAERYLKLGDEVRFLTSACDFTNIRNKKLLTLLNTGGLLAELLFFYDMKTKGLFDKCWNKVNSCI